MSNTPDSQSAEHDASDAQAEAYFDEFAGDLKSPDEAEEGSADRPRDEQGRFAAQDGDDHSEDDPDVSLRDPADQAEGAGSNDSSSDDAGSDSESDRWKQEAEHWQHRYQSDLGRQNALQRRIQEQQRQIEQLQKSAPKNSGDDGGNPDGSGYSDAEWEALKEDFPEVAQAIEKRIGALSSRYEEQINQLQTQLQPIQQQAQEQALQTEFQALEAQHPDWRDTVSTPEFTNWLQQQPPAVQQLVESNQAADAAYLLQSFKLSAGQSAESERARNLQSRRERQLKAARTISNRGNRQRSNIPDDDPDALFDYFADRA